MLTNGIDTTIRDLIAQLPKGLSGANTNTDDFAKLVSSLANQIGSAIVSAQQTASGAAGTLNSTTGAASTTTSSASQAKSQLTPFQLSVLRDQDSPMLPQLNLPASDPRYNQAESALRGRLDLTALERGLQDSAASLHVTYDRSDLDGVLRNAGYGASNLGSSQRYMAAIEKYVGEAKTRYKDRATNVPQDNT